MKLYDKKQRNTLSFPINNWEGFSFSAISESVKKK